MVARRVAQTIEVSGSKSIGSVPDVLEEIRRRKRSESNTEYTANARLKCLI